ncbi:MAG: hypothetical protein ACRECY_01075 [Phyllobacterium sp.]
MGLHGNSKRGKRSSAPLLISIFWLVSTLSATLGAGYMVSREAPVAAADARTPIRNDAQLAQGNDNQSTPAQRPMRVAALEALHLKIKSGLRSDAGPQGALLPPLPSLAVAYERNPAVMVGDSGLALDRDPLFSARAPPAAQA